MASLVYNRAKTHWSNTGSKRIDWEEDTFRAIAMTVAYTPDPDDAYVANINANEGSGANRPAIPNRLVSVDLTSDVAFHLASDFSFTGASGGSDISGFAVYKEIAGGSDSQSRLVAWLEFETPVSPNGTDIDIQLPGGRVYKGT